MYTPLYIKTENTLLSSLIKIDELIEYAKKKNIKSLTITDNKMYGAYHFYKKCVENDIKPIIGLEVIVEDNKIVIYAKNYNGYKNLLKLSSLELINIDNLNKYNNDLICIIPFEYKNIYNELKKIYKEIFIGYKNIEEEAQISNENSIYMNEILYLEQQDNIYLRYLKSIKEGIPVKHIEEIYDNNLKLFEEIKNKYPKYLENNYKINELCNLKIEYEKDLLPKYPCPNNMNSFEYLKKLCIEGLKKIFGQTANKIYIDRLKYELEIINKMGFCNYFLIVWDYVKYAKENNILVGPGRGSAAGSLVSYVLNITTIDPIKYNLFFERFLNPERITMPDIDIDFEYTRRQEVVDYCINKYGIKNVAPIITFGTLGAKQALRDVGKSLEIPLTTIDHLCNLIDSKKDLKTNYKENKRIQNSLNTEEILLKLYKIATKLEGLKRHTSIHAAGIVMCDKPLDEVIPLEKNNDLYITAYSMEYLEEQGLLKMDFLALKNLTLINDILKEINVNFDEIEINDKKTIELFTKGQTNGIFQFESAGMINFLNKFKPNSFEEIIASIALYRPGPMDNIDTYIKRKRNIEPVKYIVEELKPILKSTYGIIVYQEQIMQIANVMADYSLGEADVLRRAMSKKKEEILLKEKEKFIKRSIKKGFNKETSEEVYNLILKFASYGFNRAHSVAYAMISYKIAYLKVHYPQIFMKHLLNTNIGSETKTKEYIYECKLNNVNILKSDINISDKKYKIENNYLICPLTNIKGIGIQTVNNIIEKRTKPFIDIFDFIKRCNDINKKTLENLILAGCFENLNYNKKTLIENLEKILNYSELGELLEDQEYIPIIEEYPEYDKKYLMKKELEIFGFYLSNHPITEYKHKYKTINITDIPNYFDKIIDIIVYVDRVKEIETKKGEKMAFITGSDEIHSIDIALFPKTYTEIKQHDIVYLKAKVEKRFDKYQLIVYKIIEIIN